MVGLVDEIPTDQHKVGIHPVDLVHRPREGRHVMTETPPAELGVAHLDEGEALTGGNRRSTLGGQA